MPRNDYAGDLAFLSNSYISSVYIDGKRYPSAAHAYVAMKTSDEAIRTRIRGLKTPREAYSEGRKFIVRPEWNTIREQVMLDVLRKKFESPFLASMLRNVSDEQLGHGWLASLLRQIRTEVIDNAKEENDVVNNKHSDV